MTIAAKYLFFTNLITSINPRLLNRVKGKIALKVRLLDGVIKVKEAGIKETNNSEKIIFRLLNLYRYKIYNPVIIIKGSIK